MPLLPPIVHCLVDQEPTSFHESDADGTTFSFAVNLSFEARAEKPTNDPKEIEQEEADARKQFEDFLADTPNVAFHLFAVTDATQLTLAYVAPLGKISGATPPGAPDDLVTWLGDQLQNAPRKMERYWSTLEAWAPDEAIDTDGAKASHQMRAVQAWNAPIGHRFSLTHIVTIPRDKITSPRFVVLPYFGTLENPLVLPVLEKAHDYPPGKPQDIVKSALDYSYNPHGKRDKIVCRTNLIGEGITGELDPGTVDRGLTSGGYFMVDERADQVRRLLVWFEERAASLMAANGSLNSRAKDPKNDPAFEALFGVKVVDKDKDGKPIDPKFCWGSIVWYVAARLISTLDNLVIAFVKPLADDKGALAFDRGSEGEMLAPLVSKFREELDRIAPTFKLDDSALGSQKIAAAVRSTVAAASPLVAAPQKSSAEVVRVLRQVFGITAAQGDAPRDAIGFIAAILTRYGDSAGGVELPAKVGDYVKTIPGKSVQTVARALLDLEQPLLGEAGAEAAIVRLVEAASTQGGASVASLVATAYLNEIKKAADTALQAAVEAAFGRAWTAYRQLLDGDFNGAEAVRRAAGSSFVAALLREPKPAGTTDTPAWLSEVVTQSAFYSRRLLGRGTTAKCFDPLVAALVVPERETLLLIPEKVDLPLDYPALLAATADALAKHLDVMFGEALAPIRSLDDPNARFIPDSTPQPLAIQIASSIDGGHIDEFEKRFNGIAVAIQRVDKNASTDPWAHAHLADLRWDKPKKKSWFDKDLASPHQSTMAALHTMLPAVSDGRGPMFVEYQGFPFADRALDARVVDSEGGARDTRRPFYRQDPHDKDESPKFAPVPRLAYGRTFKTFSFVTSNAGTLPLSLQDSAAAPWMPKQTVEAPETEKEAIGRVPYQRRTAIAQMAVSEPDNVPHRIGALIKGVMPLATDYARMGLEAEKEAAGTRDIFREGDGSGTITATQNAEWRISRMAFSGAPSSLTVRFFDRSAQGPADTGTKEFKIDEKSVPGFAKLTEMTIRVTFKPTTGVSECWLSVEWGTEILEERLADQDALTGWLRLVLTSDSSAALTFATPVAQKSDNVTAPLLVLVPGGDQWIANLARDVTATVRSPRVSYLDFERWFANGTLYERTFKEDPQADGPAAHLMSALLTAYLMRHFDADLARMIDRLPDPAVERIRLELTALDNLTGDPIKAVKAVSHDLANRLREFAKKLEETNKGEEWTPAKLLKFVLKPLDELFTFRIRLMAGSPLSLKLLDKDATVPRVEAAVPPGVTARLSLDALVPAEFFADTGGTYPAVFHRGLKQYALRTVSAYLAFPAAALCIETMYDGIKDVDPINLAARMIVVEGVERTRCFHLMTEPAAPDAERERRWKLLGEIDVTTQRWRPSGRPIYHYVNPRAFRNDGVGPEAEVVHPALRLKIGGDPETRKPDPLAEFEREAFFDRSDVDGQTLTHRLDPLPSRTRLQEHHWDSPAATYFRHRFTLRSRYAGALKERREVAAWNTGFAKNAEQAPYAWTMRVAMLADLSRILLTRPQLRALIPLTTTPGDDAARRAPPVAAVLQEPPFARGGLADRIASEIKTGFGYGFADDTKHVEILDSRKEGGPSPHLDYRPLKSDTALGLVLRSEGPLGLTFDNVNAPAPAYPNSMLLLAPDTLVRSEPLSEELFVGVAMRRYIDPDWTTSPHLKVKELDGERCWWIIPKQQAAAAAGPQELLNYVVEGHSRLLLSLLHEGEQVIVKASRLAIDGTGGTGEDGVPVLKVDLKNFGGLATLHQVVAPGRYSASVFVVADSADAERGKINAPTLLASFEWSPPEARQKPDDPDRKPPVVTLTGTIDHAVETMASASTFLRWTKTSRDFDFVHIPVLATDPKTNKESWTIDHRHVRELVAALDSNHHQLTFARSGAEETVWLCPSTFNNPYPLHLHRHLGVVTSYFLKELGRPMELFDRTAAMRENRAVLVAPDGTSNGSGIYQPREHVARVVEFETPAQILCDSQVSAPEKYKTAYFDLVSTGFMKDAGDQLPDACARLYFRFVGPPAQLRQISSLVILLRNTPKISETMKLSFDLKNTPKAFAVGVQIILRQPTRKSDDTKATVKAEVLLLRSSGNLEDATPKIENVLILTKADNKIPGLFVSVDAKSPAGEFWTDVSLLHSANSDKDAALDFDWLFTPDQGKEPAVSVSAPGLNTMIEAQARVIAVSPPIPIVKH